MKRFKVEAHVGICRPIHFLVWANTAEEALAAASGPEDNLRERIECKMVARDVDPEIRGWHNYEASHAEEYRGGAEELADKLREAGHGEAGLEDALARAVFQDEVDADMARDLCGTARGELVLARIGRYAERVRESRGYLGLAAALYKLGVTDAGQVARLSNG